MEGIIHQQFRFQCALQRVSNNKVKILLNPVYLPKLFKSLFNYCSKNEQVFPSQILFEFDLVKNRKLELKILSTITKFFFELLQIVKLLLCLNGRYYGDSYLPKATPGTSRKLFSEMCS